MKPCAFSFLIVLNLILNLAPELAVSKVSALSVLGDERKRSFKVFLLSKLSLMNGLFNELFSCLESCSQEFRWAGGEPRTAGFVLINALSFALIVYVSKCPSRLSEPYAILKFVLNGSESFLFG